MRTTSSTLTLANWWDHFLARWGVNRSGHRVEPGLYALGDPTPDSPVLVTANYTLSFDALRSALRNTDAYLLVLDTEGINVWCAAGKGTFGTEELGHRIEATELAGIVRHRELILPQLGAPGVNAHEVQRGSGFSVKYGPVRAADLEAYLAAGEAAPEMRRVRFGLLDRVLLMPVELVHVFWPTMGVALLLWLAAGGLFAAGLVSAVAAGVVLFPILLPWIPTRDFTSKGFVLGGTVCTPFALTLLPWKQGGLAWIGPAWAGAFLLMALPVAGFLALNFTGSTPFTSRTGVRREIQKYTRPMAAMLGGGMILLIALIVIGLVSER
jgi:hypothetical protein